MTGILGHGPRRLAAVPLLFAVTMLLGFSDPAAAVPTDDHIVFVYAPEHAETASVLQWIDIDGPHANDTRAYIAIPKGGARTVITNDTGATLHAVEYDHGSYAVGVPRGSRAVLVTTDGLSTPLESVRFDADALWATSQPVWIIANLPPSRSLAPDLGAEPVADEILRDAAWWPALWPDAYVDAEWTATPLARMPTTVGFPLDHPIDVVAPYTLFTLLVVALAATTLWLTARIHAGLRDPRRVGRRPVLEHLEELRRRAIRVVVTLTVASVFFFSFGFHYLPFTGALLGFQIPIPWPSLYDNAGAQAFAWISSKITPPGVQVIVISPWDAVMTQLTLAFGLAFLVTFPVLFHQLYAFLAPGLLPKERRAVLVAVPAVIGLFVAGAAFGLLVMAPLMMAILYGFTAPLGATPLLNVADLVSMAALMGIVFGLSFQLPVLMALSVRLGLTTAAAYRRRWRHAMVAILVVAALVTDPTIVSQILVASVLLVLYGAGLVLCALVEKRRAPASTVPRATA